MTYRRPLVALLVFALLFQSAAAPALLAFEEKSNLLLSDLPVLPEQANDPIELDLIGMPVRDFFALMGSKDWLNLNLVLTENIPPDSRINVLLNDMTIGEAFNLVLQLNGLKAIAFNDKTLIITSRADTSQYGVKTQKIYRLQRTTPERVLDFIRSNPNLASMVNGDNIIANTDEGTLLVFETEENIRLLDHIIHLLEEPSGRETAAIPLSNIDKTGFDTAVQALPAEIADRIQTDRILYNENARTLIVYDTPENIELIREIVQKIDLAPKQVLIDSALLQVSETFNKTLGFQFLTNQFTVSSFDQLLKQSRLNRQLTDNQIFPTRTQINYLINKTGARTLQSPKIRTIDGVQATINIGEIRNVQIQSTQIAVGTAVAPGQQQVTFNTQEVPIGVQLTVTPAIHNDKTVTLDVRISVTKVLEIKQFGVDRTTQDSQTTLRVRDGETVILGGFINEQHTSDDTPLPLLGEVPFLDKIFKNKRRDRQDSELVFLLTPYILDYSTYGASLAQGENVTTSELDFLAARARRQHLTDGDGEAPAPRTTVEPTVAAPPVKTTPAAQSRGEAPEKRRGATAEAGDPKGSLRRQGRTASHSTEGRRQKPARSESAPSGGSEAVPSGKDLSPEQSLSLLERLRELTARHSQRQATGQAPRVRPRRSQPPTPRAASQDESGRTPERERRVRRDAGEGSLEPVSARISAQAPARAQPVRSSRAPTRGRDRVGSRRVAARRRAPTPTRDTARTGGSRASRRRPNGRTLDGPPLSGEGASSPSMLSLREAMARLRESSGRWKSNTQEQAPSTSPEARAEDSGKVSTPPPARRGRLTVSPGLPALAVRGPAPTVSPTRSERGAPHPVEAAFRQRPAGAAPSSRPAPTNPAVPKSAPRRVTPEQQEKQMLARLRALARKHDNDADRKDEEHLVARLRQLSRGPEAQPTVSSPKDVPRPAGATVSTSVARSPGTASARSHGAAQQEAHLHEPAAATTQAGKTAQQQVASKSDILHRLRTLTRESSGVVTASTPRGRPGALAQNRPAGPPASGAAPSPGPALAESPSAAVRRPLPAPLHARPAAPPAPPSSAVASREVASPSRKSDQWQDLVKQLEAELAL